MFRSEETLAELCSRLGAVFESAGLRYELLLVEDGGGDDSWSKIVEIAETNPAVRAFRMRRNYGQHAALLCGIRAARGSCVVTLDDDLQNPPEEIPQLLAELHQGFDVVYGVPSRQRFSLWRKVTSRLIKRLLRKAGVFRSAESVSSFRAFRVGLREAFADYRSPSVNVDVLLSWATDNYSSVDVRHDPRRAGQSAYSFWKLARHTLNMVTGFSTTPLRLASLLGFGASLFGFLLLAYVIGLSLFVGRAVPGFAFIASMVALFSGIQLFGLGLIGEYLGRLYLASMGQPGYVVAERHSGRSGSVETDHQSVSMRPRGSDYEPEPLRR